MKKLPNPTIQYYVYLHCKPNGDPFYVGKGFGKRAYKLDHRNKHHINIVNKYGKGNVDILVFPMSSEQEAFDTEILWISTLKKHGYTLCNQTNGGEGLSGYTRSIESQAKINAANIGRVVSPETRTKIGLASIGRIVSPETRKKISTTSMGREVSSEVRRKISIGNTGKKRTVEQRTKLSAKLKGRKLTPEHHAKITGWNHTDEAKANISAAHKGKKKSPESVAKSAATRTGSKRTEETKAKLKAAWVLRKQKALDLASKPD